MQLSDIKSVTVGNAEGDNFVVVTQNDNTLNVPDVMDNRHRKLLQEWIDAGNTPAAYVAPVSEKYPALTKVQFMAMVDMLGKEGAIVAAIDDISDATQKAVAKAKFNHSDQYDRDDPLFTQLASAVGMTDADIDAAWTTAKDF